MRSRAAYAALALLILPVACQVPGIGSGAADDGEVRCGPQPAPKQVERLVRQEHPGGAARDFSYSRLEPWRVQGEREVFGWRVVVDVTRRIAPGRSKTSRHAYLIARGAHGFGILAAAEGRPDSQHFAWTLRPALPRSPDPERQEELERRRQAWERARQVPTTEELVAAEFGPRPIRYRKKIQEHLHVAVGLPDSATLRVLPLVRTWARRVGSHRTVFGWRVTAIVSDDSRAAGDRVKPYHFMFRGSQIVSTTRLGQGFQLVAEGETPGPPPPRKAGLGQPVDPPR